MTERKSDEQNVHNGPLTINGVMCSLLPCLEESLPRFCCRGEMWSYWGGQGVGRLNIWLKGLCHAALPDGLLAGCKYN